MRCPRCNTELSERIAVCPACEAVIKDPSELKRKKENVPVIEDRYTIVSHNYNGTFNVKQARDGSYAPVPHFCSRTGRNTDTPFSTCAHKALHQETITPCLHPSRRVAASLLKTMGEGSAHLSNAYFVSELLALKDDYGRSHGF